MQSIGGRIATGLRRWGFFAPARAIDRLAAGEAVSLPRIVTITPVALLLSTAIIAGLGAGDGGIRVIEDLRFAVNQIARAAGLGITTITVTGISRIEEWKVLEALDVDATRSLLTFDPAEAREKLQGLPWVRNAAVQKLYPGALRVSIEEREPRALWQRAGRFFVIDNQGKVLEPFEKARFGPLPLVVGEGAAETAAPLFAALDATPEIKGKTKAATRVGGRRWTLTLSSGTEIKLPESGFEDALSALATLDRETGLLGKAIEGVDLRIPDRMTVRLTPEAAERQRAPFEDRKDKPDNA